MLVTPNIGCNECQNLLQIVTVLKKITLHSGKNCPNEGLFAIYKDSNDTTSLSLLRSAPASSAPKHKDIEITAIETLTAPIVYPNPTRDVFMVKTTLSEEEDMEIRVYDNVGRLVKVEKTVSNETNIFLHNEPTEIYFIRLTLKNKTYNYKVVKI